MLSIDHKIDTIKNPPPLLLLVSLQWICNDQQFGVTFFVVLPIIRKLFNSSKRKFSSDSKRRKLFSLAMRLLVLLKRFCVNHIKPFCTYKMIAVYTIVLVQAVVVLVSIIVFNFCNLNYADGVTTYICDRSMEVLGCAQDSVSAHG